jgi:putative hydrolase of the HAD superfamily
MQKPAIKAVVFDLYKTLISEPQGKGISPYRNLYSQLGLPEEDYLTARRIFMTEYLGSFEAVAERLVPGARIDTAECHRLYEEAVAAIALYPEVELVLDELKKRGLLVGLISNLSTLFKRPFFELGLADYFDQIVFSFEVGFVKPNSEIYRIMIRRLGLRPEEIIMTGDQYSKDVDAPRLAGMQAVHLDRSGKSPGSIPDLTHIFQYL